MKPFVRLAPVVLRLSILLALGGSLWSLLGRQGCNSCDRAADALGEVNLALLGVMFYGVLLVVSLAGRRGEAFRDEGPETKRGTADWLAWCTVVGMCFAGGLHLALVAVLLRNRMYCIPCLFTASAAFLGALAACLGHARALRFGLTIVTVAAVAGYAGTRVLRPDETFWKHRIAIKAARKVVAENRSIPQGRCHLVVFMREGCHRCVELEEQALPKLREEFGPLITIEFREAPYNFNTPTIVVLGMSDTVFDGKSTVDDLRIAVQQATGAASRPKVTRTGIPL